MAIFEICAGLPLSVLDVIREQKPLPAGDRLELPGIPRQSAGLEPEFTVRVEVVGRGGWVSRWDPNQHISPGAIPPAREVERLNDEPQAAWIDVDAVHGF